jgi:uncharacterized cupredoxin-like copper-binding protein
MTHGAHHGNDPMKITVRNRLLLGVAIPLAVGAHASWAHGQTHRGKDDAHATAPQGEAFGEPGAVKDISRTTAIHMFDAMRFNPAALTFVQGETVRLHIVNDGKLPHEFVLGTRREIDEHEDMMRKMPGMVHADASSASVAPGKSVDLVWKFSERGTFLYACLVPGHLEAGMEGVVTVTARIKQ